MGDVDLEKNKVIIDKDLKEFTFSGIVKINPKVIFKKEIKKMELWKHLLLPLAKCNRCVDLKVMQLLAACVELLQQHIVPINPGKGHIRLLFVLKRPKFRICTCLCFVRINKFGLNCT